MIPKEEVFKAIDKAWIGGTSLLQADRLIEEINKIPENEIFVTIKGVFARGEKMSLERDMELARESAKDLSDEVINSLIRDSNRYNLELDYLFYLFEKEFKRKADNYVPAKARRF